MSLAKQFAKSAASLIIGATKVKYFDAAVGALNIQLTGTELEYLEELYIPHKVVGAL